MCLTAASDERGRLCACLSAAAPNPLNLYYLSSQIPFSAVITWLFVSSSPTNTLPSITESNSALEDSHTLLNLSLSQTEVLPLMAPPLFRRQFSYNLFYLRITPGGSPNLQPKPFIKAALPSTSVIWSKDLSFRLLSEEHER